MRACASASARRARVASQSPGPGSGGVAHHAAGRHAVTSAPVMPAHLLVEVAPERAELAAAAHIVNCHLAAELLDAQALSESNGRHRATIQSCGKGRARPCREAGAGAWPKRRLNATAQSWRPRRGAHGLEADSGASSFQPRPGPQGTRSCTERGHPSHGRWPEERPWRCLRIPYFSPAELAKSPMRPALHEQGGAVLTEGILSVRCACGWGEGATCAPDATASAVDGHARLCRPLAGQRPQCASSASEATRRDGALPGRAGE